MQGAWYARFRSFAASQTLRPTSWAPAQPELAKSNPFGTGSEQQNAARTMALNAIQPAGAPEAVGNTVRQQTAAIEAGHDAAVAIATTDAQRAASGIGAGVAPQDIGSNSEPRCKGPGTPLRRKSALCGGQ